MSKAVMLSIQPKWCELIANGKKTVEVRKTKPKIETPFRCYIYCTKSKDHFQHNGIVDSLDDLYRLPSGEIKHGYSGELMCCNEPYDKNNFMNGKVIGEFMCNNIDNHCLSNLVVKEDAEHTLNGTCLTKEEVLDYLGYQKGTSIYACKNYDFYGWHISDLVIYDYPKELSEFYRHDNTYDNAFGWAFEDRNKSTPITRPPQSWCYVEEMR